MFTNSDLVIFDYEYLKKYQIKEEFLNSTLNNLLEKLTFKYDLGIISNHCLHQYLQRKKINQLFKYIFNYDGNECYQDSLLIKRYKIINFLNISQTKYIISSVENFKKNVDMNNNNKYELSIKIEYDKINISFKSRDDKNENISAINGLIAHIKDNIKMFGLEILSNLENYQIHIKPVKYNRNYYLNFLTTNYSNIYNISDKSLEYFDLGRKCTINNISVKKDTYINLLKSTFLNDRKIISKEATKMKIGLILSNKNNKHFNILLNNTEICLIQQIYKNIDPEKFSECQIIFIDINNTTNELQDVQIKDTICRLKIYNSNLTIILNSSMVSVGFCNDLECFMMSNSYFSEESYSHKILMGLSKNKNKNSFLKSNIRNLITILFYFKKIKSDVCSFYNNSVLETMNIFKKNNDNHQMMLLDKMYKFCYKNNIDYQEVYTLGFNDIIYNKIEDISSVEYEYNYLNDIINNEKLLLELKDCPDLCQLLSSEKNLKSLPQTVKTNNLESKPQTVNKKSIPQSKSQSVTQQVNTNSDNNSVLESKPLTESSGINTKVKNTQLLKSQSVVRKTTTTNNLPKSESQTLTNNNPLSKTQSIVRKTTTTNNIPKLESQPLINNYNPLSKPQPTNTNISSPKSQTLNSNNKSIHHPEYKTVTNMESSALQESSSTTNIVKSNLLNPQIKNFFINTSKTNK